MDTGTGKKGKDLKNARWSTRFHIMPPVGWLNDPNGLCYYNGDYHFFFQYAPFDAKGGLKFWGHMKSRDMLHWTYEGVPLFPDSPYDCHGVYSGSAFTEDGQMELFYTGNVKLDGDYDYVSDGREANVIYTASQDGIHFTAKKCLLTSADYPEDYTRHVRDPKVFRENGRYYMLLGGRKKNDAGAALLYESADKMHWTLKEEFQTADTFGYMWECPDLFSLDENKVLSVSPQGLAREAFKNQNVYQSGYFLLRMEKHRARICLWSGTWDLTFTHRRRFWMKRAEESWSAGQDFRMWKRNTRIRPLHSAGSMCLQHRVSCQ